jgi:hypothetical protein
MDQLVEWALCVAAAVVVSIGMYLWERFNEKS